MEQAGGDENDRDAFLNWHHKAGRPLPRREYYAFVLRLRSLDDGVDVSAAAHDEAQRTRGLHQKLKFACLALGCVASVAVPVFARLQTPVLPLPAGHPPGEGCRVQVTTYAAPSERAMPRPTAGRGRTGIQCRPGFGGPAFRP